MITRREFVKKTVAGASMLTLSSLFGGCIPEKFLQKHFKQMSREEIDRTIRRLEHEYQIKFSKEVRIKTTPAQKGVVFGMALDLSKCIGCRRCVQACNKENNQSRQPEIQWIDVLEMKHSSRNLIQGDRYYEHESVPEEGHFYLPVQCQQCEDPPCVKVCPAKATWKEPDGIVVIDYDWCIGCRYCLAACPYGARKFNWTAPQIPADEVNPQVHYLGNRPREKGVIEKCTFCLQRTREGQYPACIEACPTGARKFGNLLDPESVVRKILAEKDIFILKPESNTKPRFYYYFG
ncbi:MAG: sulfate reduction electron transfer complex DsrMKJOP subunit DsrO [bacterium]